MRHNLLMVCGVVLGLTVAGSPAVAQTCVGNPIAVENCLPGNPPAEWDISGAGDPSIEGFATDISVNRGGTIDFKIKTDATAYRIDIYRLGYYQGNGARKVATVYPSVALPQSQPACLTGTFPLLTDCGNWSVSASWAVPADAVSGLYLARPVRMDPDPGGASHIAFVVRDDSSTSDLLFKTSDTTWQAYNTWGGYSLYVGVARKVSYNRPFYTRANSTEDWLFNAEYPMIRWLEANGYDVSYTTDIDTDKYGAIGPNRILDHKVFLSVGHDEYWSAAERAAVEEAREDGVHLAFFSGNEIYWKIRWEPSTDGASTPYRTLVCYKEGTMGENTCGGRCDPLAGVWTGLWRSGCPPEYTGLDACRPENALSGNISWMGSTGSIEVPQVYGGLRFWRNTTIATLPAGQVATLPSGTLGYEWDFDQYLNFYPPGRIAMSEVTLTGQTHHLSLYRHYASGGSRRGLVFGAGTVQWSWGLDGNHDRGASTPDARMQQATVNLFADMGVQPATLQAGLTAATASTDETPPSSSIDSPLAGSTVQINVPITISGIASDTEGVVGVVEVSVDGGATWRRATGRETWSYTWTPTAYGSVTIRSRAADDSGNIETPGTGVTVTVGDTPSGPPDVPVANADSYTTDRNVALSVPAPGVLGNDTDTNEGDTLTAVLRTGTTHGTLVLSANGSFTYTPALDWAGSDSFTYRAQDPGGNLSAPATVTIHVAQTCPCTIFAPTSEPVSPKENDPAALEVGVRFRSDVDGYVTALRFFKHPTNTGTHVGHLWSSAGALLASEAFTGESGSGWQEVTLATPVPITAGATYIASYHTTTGYAQDMAVFAASGVDNPPLHALQDGVAGPNGTYNYCAAPGCFPTQGYQSSNYYVDVVFVLSVGPDTTPPTVTSVAPIDGAGNVAVTSNVLANFSEAIDPLTLDGTTFELRDGLGDLVPATVTYSAAARQAILDPTASLAYDTVYTATLKGGTFDPRVKDVAGNALADDRVWSFTTGGPPPPGPNEGPGGPILVVASSTNPFTRYFAEILRTEGLNYFTVTDIQNVTSTVLASHRTVILGEMALDAAQVTMFTDWVTGGGRLVAMRPDKQLAGLLGLTDAGTTLANAYLLIDTASQPGLGLVDQTIQFHGAADRYTLDGATALAMLYSDASTATTSPAVTVRSVGAGRAAAFTYDLAWSVVTTRQGNPLWAGDERDGRAPLRSDDMFFGAKAGDPQPDWIDLNKVAIPQADEQQRLLAKLIQHMDVMPLPRFWFLPSMKKAAVVMTGDHHGCCGATRTRFQTYETQSPVGCSLADWECIRASSYVYINGDMSDAEAMSWHNKGFELGIHLDTGCANYTSESVDTLFTNQLAAFSAQLPSLPRQSSHRTHCIAWSGWAIKAEKQAIHGIRLDTNYYFWPPEWVLNRPGMFTGSGMPMRFAQLDGTMIDVYQATTQMTDESGQNIPYTIDTLLDRALGPEQYYGVFTANMHTDQASHAGSDAIVASAKARGIPVVSGRQMLEWLDGRNASRFGDLAWDGNTLSFSVTAAAGARNLRGMVPRISSVGALTGITRDGTPIAYTTETIKGVDYAIFDATTGAYGSTYAMDTTPPVITNVAAAPGFGGTAIITWDTSTEPSDSRVDYGTDPGSLPVARTDAALVTSHSLTLTGLLPNTVYHYRVTSKDSFNNASTYPVPPATLSFTTPSATFQDTTAADFAAGTTGTCSYVSETSNGEVILVPTLANEFSGISLPTDWTSVAWVSGGTSTVSGGSVAVDGSRLTPLSTTGYGAGRSLEFVATFGPSQYQNAGFGAGDNSSTGSGMFADGSQPWAMFGTAGSTTNLYARLNPGGDVDLGSTYLNAPHRYRIEWRADNTVEFFIDGVSKDIRTASFGAITMRPGISDYAVGGPSLQVDWIRMSPYPASCAYLSRVLDSGALANWGTMSWTGETPVGTSLAMNARLGNTPVPDGTWTGWMLVPSSGSTIGGQSQYLQYRADLATTNVDATPALTDVTIGYNLGADTTPPTITGRTPAPGATGVSAAADVVVEFSEPMNAATINATTITLRAVGAGSDVPAVVTSSGATATLDPAGLLAAGQEYRVTVSGSVADLAGNTLGADDTWTFTIFLDAAPPTISSIVATPGAGGTTADITWTTDETATSRVDYGTSPESLTLNAENPTLVLSHSLPLSGLSPSTTYYYRVTSADGSSNSATSPVPPATLSFTTAAGYCFADRVVADFSAGTPDANTAISMAGDGAVTLEAALDESFDGTALPAGWSTYSWNAGSSAIVAGGSLTVDGLRANPEPFTAGPGSSLEFVATFAGDALQHAGFGGGNHASPPVLFNSYPWAMFSTGSSGGAMLARVVTAGGPEINTVIPGSWLGAPHTFRIDWDATEFRFWIDGELRHTQVTPISDPMRPAVSDYTTGAGTLVVDWMKLLSYPASGTFASRIYDAGVHSSWGAATWTATLPAGTSLAISTRQGNTPTPDGTWTAFTPVPSSGSVVGGSSRYIQYSATLATTDPQVTPALEELGIACTAAPPDVTPPVISSVAASPGGNGTTATITWTTDEPATSRVDYGTSPESLTLNAANLTLVLSHSVPLSGLSPSTTYYYRVTSQDASTNSATSPEPPATLSFTTPEAPCPSDATAADFALGTPDANTAVSSTVGDGAVVLRRTVDEEFSGTALPSGWTSASWLGGGSLVVGGGQITVDGWRADPPQDFLAGATMEFVATFSAGTFQHVGFYTGGGLFTTYILIGTSDTTNTIFARATGTPTERILIGGAELMGTPHLYRIEWKTSSVDYYVDGVYKATQPLAHAGPLKASISEYNPGGPVLSVDWLRITPYLSPGTFLSRVFDQGGPTSWGALSYAASTPTGTSVSTSVRVGNTPTPDGSWTAFAPVANGGNVGGGSRYVQYRAVLASSDPAATPDLQDIAIACTPGGDVTPPTISSIVATPGAGGTTADITWNTDEPASSRVDYGTSPGDLSRNSASSTLVTSHTLSLTSLTPSTVYYYRVTSVDFSGNSATSPTPPATLSFVTEAPPPPVCAQDQTAADFAAGTRTNTIVTQVADGEVTLAPTLQQDFDGTSLPSGWQAAAWGGGSTPTVGGGVLTMNGGHAATTATFGSGSSIEFVATFGGEVNQHIGLTADFDFNSPWALFSTMNSTSGLYARVNSPDGSTDNLIGGAELIGSAHRYRIDWKAASFDFHVDGVLVSTIPRTISSNMLVHGSDLPAGPLTLTLDWMRVTPYLTPGTFDSRIHDGGASVSWEDITWTSTLPTGTSASISVRTGNTSTPDGTWTAFAPIAASGDPVGQVGRYLQYQATLSTTDPGQTPVLEDVTLRCGPPPECTVDLDCDDGNPCTDDTCVGASVCVRTNNTATCDDGSACTQTDTCQAGTCVGGNPVVCTALDQCHAAGTCDPGTGLCSNPMQPDGTSCNDLDPCTSGDQCMSGTCVRAAFSCTVGGNVFYYRDSTDPEGIEDTSTKGVPGIGLVMTGYASGSTASADPDGAYGFLASKGITITPQVREGMFHNGISSLDASRIAQSTVESFVLTPWQQTAADVSGNTRITSYDAALVAQWVVAIIPRFPVAVNALSDWVYVPASRAHTVGGDVGGADFLGILYGDVTGNWGEANGGFRAAVEEDASIAGLLEEQAAIARVRPPGSVSTGATIYVASAPRRLPDGSFEAVLGIRGSDGILAIDLSLLFDPDLATEIRVERTGLSSGMVLTQNARTDRHLVSLFGVVPLEGAGPFLKIVYRAESTRLTLPLAVTAEANEGAIPLGYAPGIPVRKGGEGKEEAVVRGQRQGMTP